MTNTSTDINERIALAAAWYDQKPEAIDRIINDDLMANPQDIWSEFAAERDEHRKSADAYATSKTGYTWSLVDFHTDVAKAWQVLADCEYGRLEAGARERRIMALTAILR